MGIDGNIGIRHNERVGVFATNEGACRRSVCNGVASRWGDGTAQCEANLVAVAVIKVGTALDTAAVVYFEVANIVTGNDFTYKGNTFDTDI